MTSFQHAMITLFEPGKFGVFLCVSSRLSNRTVPRDPEGPGPKSPGTKEVQKSRESPAPFFPLHTKSRRVKKYNRTQR